LEASLRGEHPSLKRWIVISASSVVLTLFGWAIGVLPNAGEELGRAADSLWFPLLLLAPGLPWVLVARKAALVEVALGIVALASGLVLKPGQALAVAAAVFTLASLSRFAWRLRTTGNPLTVELLYASSAVFLAALAIPGLWALTSALFPRTLDAALVRLEPWLWSASWFANTSSIHPVLVQLAGILLVGLAVSGVGLDLTRSTHPRLLRYLLWAAAISYLCDWLIPAVGPGALAQFASAAALPMPRIGFSNAGISMAILVVGSPGQARRLRTSFAIGLSLSALLSLGAGTQTLLSLGASSLVSLAAVGVVDLFENKRARFALIYALGWLVLSAWWVRVVGGVVAQTIAFFTFLLACVGALGVLRLVWIPKASEPADPAAADRSGQITNRRRLAAIGSIFLLSGFAALCYEVVFAKSLALTFGSTTRATTIVLAVYMGGIAIGSWLGGVFAARLRKPLAAYAGCELGIALWCALTPLISRLIQSLYTALAAGTPPGARGLIVLQMALATLLLSPPTLLMGMTLPFLARETTRNEQSFGRLIGLLYAANTLGASMGALLTGYLILPTLGISKTTYLAVALNFLAALLAIRLSAARERLGEVGEEGQGAVQANLSPGLVALALAVLGIGGMVSFALENTYVHLLAIVAGNSAYAFSLMLFCFLLGLGAGAWVGRDLIRRRIPIPLLLFWLELGLAAAVLLGARLWDLMPTYFAGFHRYPLAQTFAQREFIRFAVCALAMVPTAAFIGALYPIAIEAVGGLGLSGRLRRLGAAAAINTIGNIAGALLATFVLLPLLGSPRSLLWLAAVCLALGSPALLWMRGTARSIAAVALGAGFLLWIGQPRSFDWDSLSSGANVYFLPNGYGRVIDHAESPEGGLTSVVEDIDPQGRPVRTLLTNGKFQGDDSDNGEIWAQSMFTLAPLLHTQSRDAALIIGYGTGQSARVAHDAGFARLDVAELSQDIVTLANRHFEKLNQRVTEQPRVHLHVTDGRNLLLLAKEPYDFIGMEVSSIWFAGAANLYNREFYELAKSRLSSRGVLQQWLQLHRLTPEDFISIIGTLRNVFERVWIYLAQSQAVMVACHWDCGPNAATIEALERAQPMRPHLHAVGGVQKLLERRLLTPEGVNRLLVEAERNGIDLPNLVSTDDNLFLEYSTPRGNVLSYSLTFRHHLKILREFASKSPTDGTYLSQAE
jgi:predicted membrane-bound spermidine synthase